MTEAGATFYTTGMEHSPTSATGTGWEPTPWHATQRAAEEERRVRPVVNHSGPSPALKLPRCEASVVQSVADRCSTLFAIELDLQFRHGRPYRGTAYQTISAGAAPAASYVLAARG